MTTLAEALAPRSDQLNADDLIPGPRDLKITSARISKEERQTKIVINYEGDNGKPWKPCKTMGRAMVMAWAVTDEKQLVGKSVRVFRDPDVKFGDQGAVGGIRISHMSHIAKAVSVKLTVSQGKKSVFVFQPLAAESDEVTAETVRGWLDECATLDDLQMLWRNKSVAPFREQLQSHLDDRKEALSEPQQGRTDEQHGDQHDGTDQPERITDDLLASIGAGK
jgi:hypothetical protein